MGVFLEGMRKARSVIRGDSALDIRSFSQLIIADVTESRSLLCSFTNFHNAVGQSRDNLET